MSTDNDAVGVAERILLVDAHPIVRQGLAFLISCAPDLAVCGQANSPQAARHCIARLRPDLVVTGLSLGGESGVDLIKDIRIRWPDLAVLVVSMYDEAIYAERTLRAGAKGYVCKEEPVETVLQAIRHVLAGHIFLSERMSAKMLSRLVGGRDSGNGLPIDRLSDRELQIFDMLGRGMNTRMIAETLHLSTKTVDAHRAKLKEKLQIRSEGEMMQEAIRWQLSQSRKA